MVQILSKAKYSLVALLLVFGTSNKVTDHNLSINSGWINILAGDKQLDVHDLRFGGRGCLSNKIAGKVLHLEARDQR